VADGSDRLYTVIFCLVDLSCYFPYVYAIEIILNFGPNATMAKTDISNAFRIIPIHPHDHAILGIKFVIVVWA
jgi:hypothetical protein